MSVRQWIKMFFSFWKGRWTLLLTGTEQGWVRGQSCHCAFSSKANLLCVPKFLVNLVFFLSFCFERMTFDIDCPMRLSCQYLSRTKLSFDCLSPMQCLCHFCEKHIRPFWKLQAPKQILLLHAGIKCANITLSKSVLGLCKHVAQWRLRGPVPEKKIRFPKKVQENFILIF